MEADMALTGLAALVDARLAQRFRWGVTDCATWWADAVLLLTGRDPLSDLRGRWRNRREAEALLDAEGGYPALIERRVGPRIPAVRYAARGDLAGIETPRGLVVGVVLGRYVAAQSADGLRFVPLERAVMAWRVTA